MIMATLRAGVTETRPAACFVWRVVLEVALPCGAPAERAGTGGVPDLGQVPQPGRGIVAAGLVPVVAGVGVQRLQGDDQVRSGSGDPEPPGAVAAGRAVPAGRGEGEPARRRSGTGAFPVAFGFGPGAAVADRVALAVGHRHAP